MCNRVLDIWKYNFPGGIQILQDMVKRAKYVGVDTEFPGTLLKVEGDFPDAISHDYHDKRENSNILFPIQIGFGFCDEEGKEVKGYSSIQFNLQWDINWDTANAASIQFLKDHKFDFDHHKKYGIDRGDFAEGIIGSGLFFNKNLNFVGFQADYDFIFLLKLCTGWGRLPHEWKDTQKMLNIYFPNIYDLKIMSIDTGLDSGLSLLAKKVDVFREAGEAHYAGSDALFTVRTFIKFIEKYPYFKEKAAEYRGRIYGLTSKGYRGYKDGK